MIQVSRLPGALILGVDGGGSTTRVAIADQAGRVLAMSLGAGVNPMDNERWQTNLRESVAPLSRYMDRVGQACLALPAYGEARSVTERQQTFVTSLLPIRRCGSSTTSRRRMPVHLQERRLEYCSWPGQGPWSGA